MLRAEGTYARYFLASAVALATDMGTYLALLRLGVSPVPSAVSGYAVGVIVHWLLSSRFVFGSGHQMKGTRRWRAKALFAATAAMGIAVTAGIVALAVSQGLAPVAAKLIAIAVSFNVTYVSRRWLVFPS
jgi:putative flippase GtrA